ncbi:MAG: hypothetical protein J0I66_06165, partial [Microbacterium sp.]|nr:hypothetical protein [Microbacterium sp.]
QGPGADLLIDLMKRAEPILARHPVNLARIANGKKPASATWLWGQGEAPHMPPYREVHGLKGAIISAVDLVRGVGVLAGWTRIDVPGATGYLDTDYAAKARFAIDALARHDIVCVHVEAPDEASHEGRADAKVEAIERIDHDVVTPEASAREIADGVRDGRAVDIPDASHLAPVDDPVAVTRLLEDFFEEAGR